MLRVTALAVPKLVSNSGAAEIVVGSRKNVRCDRAGACYAIMIRLAMAQEQMGTKSITVEFRGLCSCKGSFDFHRPATVTFALLWIMVPMLPCKSKSLRLYLHQSLLSKPCSTSESVCTCCNHNCRGCPTMLPNSESNIAWAALTSMIRCSTQLNYHKQAIVKD